MMLFRLCAAVALVLASAANAGPENVTRPQMRAPVVMAAIVQSPRPRLRGDAVVEKAMARRQAKARGAVCGDPDLQGDVLGVVPGKLPGCGVKDAIRLRSVNGVRLSQSSVMDCTTAKALKTWVRRGATKAIGNKGGGLAELRVFAHYSCRTRNNQPGAKISEHGRGRAIDIGGLILRDGTEITVLDGWNNGHGKRLRKMHRAACGPFGTVLGPNSDSFHRNHFHFDTARYRSGSYCR